MRKIDDIEVAKMLLDPRKKSILDIARTPVTVGQIAEELNEKPSRLYYHVKKLEEAGLLELVETRQHGNLIEKYYKSLKGNYSFDLADELVKNNTDAVMEEIMKILQPGLKLLAEEFKNGSVNSFDKQVNLALSFRNITGKEWAESLANMLKATGGKEVEPAELPIPSLPEEDQNKKSKYAYFLLSYRIEDAEDEK